MKILLTLMLALIFVSVAHAEQIGDMDGDGQVGLEEVIMALQVIAGVEPGPSLGTYIPSTGNAVASDVLQGKIFSNSDSAGLTGNRSPALPGRTGQSDCWGSPGISVSCNGTGQDGDLQKGIEWPIPRFTENGDGTITDELTGLIWLQNANCFNTAVSRDVALNYANSFYDGYGYPIANLDCGLSDGSSPGEWRLPNRFELESLLDLSRFDPALQDGYPFINVQFNYYWTSSYSSYYANLGVGWTISFSGGDVAPRSWSLEPSYVWLVRDVQ